MTTDSMSSSNRRPLGIWLAWLGGTLLLVQVVAAVLWWKLPAWAPVWVARNSPWPDPAIRACYQTDQWGPLEARSPEWGPVWWSCLNQRFTGESEKWRSRLLAVALSGFVNQRELDIRVGEVGGREKVLAEMALAALDDPDRPCFGDEVIYAQHIRESGIRLFTMVKSPRAVDPLCRLLAANEKKASGQTRMLINAIAFQGERRTVPLLITWLPFDTTARDALEVMLSPGADEAVVALGDPHPDIRLWAARQVGAAPPSPSLDAALLPLLDDQVRDISLQAISDLGRRGCRQAVPGLARRLEDPDGQVRAWSAEALGMIGDGAVFAKLVQLLADSEPPTRRSAIDALGRLRDVRAVVHLLPLLAADDDETALTAWMALSTLPLDAAQREQVRAAWTARAQP